MLVKIKDDLVVTFPYDFNELRKDNPYTTFDSPDVAANFEGTEAWLAGYRLQPVIIPQEPTCDPRTQTVYQNALPDLQDGTWILGWTIHENTPEEIAAADARQAERVRDERNRRLFDSDWTQVADAPVDKAAWATYRAGLRAVSKQPGFPWIIEWPAKPE